MRIREEITVLIRQGGTWMDILNQDEWWFPSGTDHRVRLVDMDARHRRNTKRWLKRNAKAIAEKAIWGWLSLPYPNGDMAAMSFDSAVDQDMEEAYNNPVRYVMESRLYRELARLVMEDEWWAEYHARRRADPTLVLLADF